jgi:adenylate cyclase
VRRHFDTTRDDPATREMRRSILARAAIFAGLPAPRLEPLLKASALSSCEPRTVLFRRGEAAGPVFLIGSGIVQLRIGLGGSESEDDAEEDGAGVVPPLHLQLLRPGEIAADLELMALAAGGPSAARREAAAVVVGGHAVVVAIEQAALARVLEDEPAARARLAEQVAERLRRTQRLVDEALSFKQRGKIRLARYLLELFDATATLRGSALELPQELSQDEIAGALGLTRRSVFDDIKALEDFDAIDHDRSGRMVLLDRGRLERIARYDPSEDKEDDARAWVGEVDAALGAGDAVRARELAAEALTYHPRNEGLRHRAVLAALRSAAHAEAEEALARFGFTTDHPVEDIAALVPRALKDRAFLTEDPAAARQLARQSAEGYRAVHRRTNGVYPGINAATMFCIAGDLAAGRELAQELLRQLGPAVRGYWALATRAEALVLLGRLPDAEAALAAAAREPDAAVGMRASTWQQFRRLAAALRFDATPLLQALRGPPVAIIAGEAPGEGAEETARRVVAALGRRAPAVVDQAFATPFDLALLEGLKPVFAAPDVVLAAPIEVLARDPAFARAKLAERLKEAVAPLTCHLADGAAGALGPARARQARRHALGLGINAAWLREAEAVLFDPARMVDGLTVFTPTGALHPPRPLDWTAPDRLSEGFAAVLWLEAVDERPSRGIAGAAEEAAVEGGILCRFDRVSTAALAALAAATLLAEGGRRVRLCLDVERLTGGLGTARLARLRPATPANEVFATESFAAELALLDPPAAHIRPVGRVRSDKRLNRLPVWAVTRYLKLPQLGLQTPS